MRLSSSDQNCREVADSPGMCCRCCCCGGGGGGGGGGFLIYPSFPGQRVEKLMETAEEEAGTYNNKQQTNNNKQRTTNTKNHPFFISL